jgi:hypothetical protein
MAIIHAFDGNDANPGTEGAPIRGWQAAAAAAKAAAVESSGPYAGHHLVYSKPGTWTFSSPHPSTLGSATVAQLGNAITSSGDSNTKRIVFAPHPSYTSDIILDGGYTVAMADAEKNIGWNERGALLAMCGSWLTLDFAGDTDLALTPTPEGPWKKRRLKVLNSVNTAVQLGSASDQGGFTYSIGQKITGMHAEFIRMRALTGTSDSFTVEDCSAKNTVMMNKDHWRAAWGESKPWAGCFLFGFAGVYPPGSPGAKRRPAAGPIRLRRLIMEPENWGEGITIADCYQVDAADMRAFGGSFAPTGFYIGSMEGHITRIFLKGFAGSPWGFNHEPRWGADWSPGFWSKFSFTNSYIQGTGECHLVKMDPIDPNQGWHQVRFAGNVVDGPNFLLNAPHELPTENWAAWHAAWTARGKPKSLIQGNAFLCPFHVTQLDYCDMVDNAYGGTIRSGPRGSAVSYGGGTRARIVSPNRSSHFVGATNPTKLEDLKLLTTSALRGSVPVSASSAWAFGTALDKDAFGGTRD